MHKIGQSGVFLGRHLGSLLKPLDNIVSILISLGSTAPASATDTAIYEKMFGLGMTTLIISNEEMNDIMKIVRSLEESGFLKKDVSETIKNKVKRTKIRISKYVIRNSRYYFIKELFNK